MKLKSSSIRSISSVLLLSAALLTLLSYVGQSIGPDNILQDLLNRYFGLGAIFIPLILTIFGLYLTGVKWGFSRANVWVGLTIFQIAFISLISLFQNATEIKDGGIIGQFVASKLSTVFSNLGAIILISTVLFVSLLITLDASLTETLNMIGNTLVGFFKVIKEIFTHLFNKEQQISLKDIKASNENTSKSLPQVEENLATDKDKKEMKVIDPSLRQVTDSNQASMKKEKEKTENLDGLKEETVFANLPVSDKVWEYPPLSLLSDKPPVPADRGDIKQNAHKIEKALDSFGIRAKVIEVNCGPSVTQYALELTEGTKIAKVTALANDLALALAAPTGTVRIEAPIPGRSLVGIEVPNYSPTLVTLKNTLQSESFKKNKSKLSVILGHNVSGQTVFDDLSKMPHILIAGATGSGKTVCLNSFLAALLFQNAPHELKFIMVDPKRVEMVQYNGIPHLLTPVITEADKVLSAMKWSVAEMERRYKLFQKARVRNIIAYNELSGFQAIPNIVVVVDEMADLMMYAPKDFEGTICRLAQMSRATGIHLILATQRPSVDVITGLIKANIPCRVAFNVTSSVDSRVILDQPGAEKLLGRGDMLYLPPDKAKPQRIQGVYVADEELKALQDFLKEKGADQVEYHEEVTEFAPQKAPGSIEGVEPEDDLFEEAVNIVCSHQKASASLLQRRLRVGYARAARLLDQLQQRGVVSEADGAKPRNILISSPEEFFGSQKEAQEEQPITEADQ
ncbi:hypothetical protein A2X44_02685 [candidate division CPR3 bacterium GWF2_35_18]|nr:MAG: hypothetical protein A2X44_02685 [candidate division CPR3 bacterium GWF2_35_18]OGB65556.1 MAG: hypothetical protein A2250_04265 [candidate division CPR3 bacterium RIFOXYA2_FULL_35_13]